MHEVAKRAVLYRCWPCINTDFILLGMDIDIVAYRYAILSYTPCGAWISIGAGGKKFVNLRARKQWASATIEEASNQLLRRKQKYLSILRARVLETQEVIRALAEAKAQESNFTL